MTENRFQWIYIKDNTLELRDNGIVKVFNNERLEELLNELNDTNNQLQEEIKDFQTLLASREEVYIKPIIRTIEETYENERTHIGKNVLKQLLEAIQ